MTEAAHLMARVGELVAALNRHDLEAVAKALAPDAVWARGDGASVQGRDLLAAKLRGFFIALPDARLTLQQVIPVDASRVLVEWRLRGAHLGPLALPDRAAPLAATGRPVDFVGADLLTFNGAGEILRDEARIALASLAAQLSPGPTGSAPSAELWAFAESITAAWSAHDGPGVAAHYAEDGSLTINDGLPAAGRAAIAAVVEGFAESVPDLVLHLDDVYVHQDRAVYNWTLEGTNSGPGGSGKRLRISGFELWPIGADKLIGASRGYYDSAAYTHQLEHGAPEREP